MHKIVAAVHIKTFHNTHHNILIGLQHENDFIPELKRILGDDIYEMDMYWITTENTRDDAILHNILANFVEETY